MADLFRRFVAALLTIWTVFLEESPALFSKSWVVRLGCRCPPAWLRHKPMLAIEQSTNAMDLGCFDRLPQDERRQNRRDPFRNPIYPTITCLPSTEWLPAPRFATRSAFEPLDTERNHNRYGIAAISQATPQLAGPRTLAPGPLRVKTRKTIPLLCES